VRGNPMTSANEQTFYLNAGDFQKLVTEERFPTSGEVLFPKRWVAIDHAALLSSAPPEVREASLEEMSSAPSETGKAPEAVAPVRETELSLEEKLRTLEHLKDEGLISEGEYNQKREELISSF
ncbi:MAG TPA: SHOCT domain-containing protein, partial [Nitrospiria bacterium]